MTGLMAIGRRFSGLRRESQNDLLRNKKAAVVTLRWLLVIAASYLMLFTGPGRPGLAVATVAVLLVGSNAVIARLPEQLIALPGFDLLLLLLDTTLLSVGFYLTDAIGPDFYVLYFFVVFVAGVSERVTLVVAGALLACLGYLAVSDFSLNSPSMSASALALRVFFILGVALFYGFLVERIRLDRETRQAEYVSRLEEVNARLRELVEMKQSFVGAVSHELRTPLNAMLGYIDLVREGAVGEVNGPVWSYIDKAYRRGQHLRHMIEELLSFSTLSRGEARARRRQTDIARLMGRIRDTLEATAREKGLDLRFDVPEDIGSMSTDAGKLVQILLHLVTNAIKFTAAGEVRVSVRRAEVQHNGDGAVPALEFAVRDSGAGISPEKQEIIFEDFRQADGSMTRLHGGIGLGLAVCQGLARVLGGEISLQSAVGKGTTVTLCIPTDLPLGADQGAADGADQAGEEMRLVPPAVESRREMVASR